MPCKWQKQLGDDDDNKNWKECNVNYSFDKDEMNGTRLIQNLKWLGKSNELIDLFGSGSKSSPLWRQRTGGSSMCDVDNNDNDDNDDNDEEERLMGRGSFGSSRTMQQQQQSNDATTFGERELR